MAKITFIILAHENADHVADLASLLTEWDPHANAVIHYDLNSQGAQFARLRERTSSSPRIHLVKDRIKCGWGNFSLVDAVVRALRVVRREKIDCDRVMLISGACMPIRPLAELSRFLDAHPRMEFIEAYDSSWMVGGLRKERYQYWHLFNHQKYPKLFNWHFQLQRIFWPKRRFPRTLEPRFGSQWWCLSWTLCEKILNYIQKHPLTYQFFSTTWIPDELFFQTMAFRFTHTDNMARRNLTFFHFNDWGKPIILMDDHIEMLKQLPFFFARKVSPSAKKLRTHLADLAMQPAPETPLEIDFSKRYHFPYKEMIAALPQASPSTLVLFQHHSDGLWTKALEKNPRSFAILYGPPQLTRRAADALRDVAGLTVLGRVLHPDKVDFGPDVQSFHGLHSDDNLIRDFDRPAYFVRILSRIDDIAVIELCPGDDPQGEIALMLSRNAVVLPIMAEHDTDVMRQLYWTLCSGGGAVGGPHATPIDSFRAMQQAMDAKMPIDFRIRTETYLKAAKMAAETDVNDWKAALRFRHGTVATPLAENLGTMEAAINSLTMEELAADLPKDWRQSVSMLSTLHARWRLLKLNFPVALPELFTTALALQTTARDDAPKDLTESLRGLDN